MVGCLYLYIYIYIYMYQHDIGIYGNFMIGW